MNLDLEGRPALVAAASRGLGRAAALALAGEGAAVAICARDAAALGETRDEIAERTGATVVAIPADVSEPGEAARFVEEGAEALGGCQILVPNAGGPPPGRFDDLADEDFRAALDLLFFSALGMTRAALPHMRSAGYGRVVLVSSMSVREPIAGLMLSNSVRAAVSGWARTLADEVAGDGITVNAVLPGRVMTDRVAWLLEQRAAASGRSVEEERAHDLASIPLGRFGEPADVGDLVAYLASPRAAYVTGISVPVDGGAHRGLL